MNRKDYELIAQAIREELKSAEFAVAEVMAIRHVVSALAVAMRRENPRFDTDRFVRACGFEV